MTITPEQFLAMPSDPEDDQEQAPPLDPLESIAFSLRFLVDRFEAEHATETPLTEGIVTREEFDELAQAYDDLEAKHDLLRALVEEIEGIVKPSTSKLANQVRAAVQRWRAPEVPAAEPSADVVPADDAPVEAWRAYARNVRNMSGGESSIDSMNRSQIRTMLGIEQPVSEVSA